MKYYFLISCILLFSCNNEKKEISLILKNWQNKTFIIPSSFTQNKDKSIVEINNLSSKYTILNYVDTTGCTPCNLRLYEWELLKRETNNLNQNVDFLFVIYSKDYKEIEKELQINKSTISVIFDSLNIINKINKIPNNPLLQTFLLDSNRHVTLIGNPLDRKKLWQLYLNTIMDDL